MNATALRKPAPHTAPFRKTAANWLTPTPLDFFLVALLAWLFLVPPEGWGRLLEDGDTGWHIRAGEWILDQGRIPRHDLFSFTKQGEPWFAWEWGAELIYGLLHRAWGLTGVLLLSAIQILLFGVILLRYAIWRGANPLVSFMLTFLGVGAASLHYLARPHLFTLMLFPAAIWILDADRARPGKLVWVLVPLTAVWANLHGGFLALIAMAALVSVGSAIEWYWRAGDARGLRIPARYCVLAVLCAAASLANPNGIALHQHAVSYLDSEWIRQTVNEFQSPDFHNENVFQYEILLIAGIMSAASMLGRRQVVEPLWILFWAHQSLGSVRHVTLFVAVAVPVAAAEASRYWDAWMASGRARSARSAIEAVANDLRGGLSRLSGWPAILAVAAIWVGAFRWPADFPADRFPVEMAARHGELLSRSKVYTHDEWADYLIFRNWPRQRVFIDGRSDFFGPKLGNLAIEMAAAGPGWRTGLDGYGVDVVLAPPAWPLAEKLRRDESWEIVEERVEAILFQRVTNNRPTQAGSAGKFVPGGTNEIVGSSRILLGRAPK